MERIFDMDNENTNGIGTEENKLDMDIKGYETEANEPDMEVNETAKSYNMPNDRYTYADYVTWDDDIRYELIDGIAYMMSAPTINHQSISMELSRQFANFLIGKSCKVFAAPCDVCLNGLSDSDDTVVQPDILVVCDDSKIDDKRCNGAPDLIIEILSPASINHDRFRKLNKYLKAGVREYWIVDPEINDITVHILERDKYVLTVYNKNDVLPVHVLKGCNIDLSFMV